MNTGLRLHPGTPRHVKAQAKKFDERVNRLYCRLCSGVTINMMDIPKVFAAARAAEAATPGLTDEQLGAVIVKFVETIRVPA